MTHRNSLLANLDNACNHFNELTISYQSNCNNADNYDDDDSGGGKRVCGNDLMISDDEILSEPESSINEETDDKKDSCCQEIAKPMPKEDCLSSISSDEMSEVTSSTNYTKSDSTVPDKSSKELLKKWPKCVLWVCTAMEYMSIYGVYLLFSGLNFYIDKLFKYTDQCTLFKAIIHIPRATINRLYCFANLNACRRVSTYSFMGLPKCKNAKPNTTVFTPCTWPMFALAATICGIFVAGCHTTDTNSSIGTKYKEGLAATKHIMSIIREDIYYIPGRNCMESNNCCIDTKTLVIRWTKCMATYPFRIARNAWARTDRVSSFQQMDDSIHNVTDWRLKRNLFRLKVSIETLVKMVKMIQLKVNKFDLHDGVMNDIFNRNVSSFELLRIIFETDEKHLYDSVTDYEEMMSTVRFFSDILKRFKRTKFHSEKCVQCVYKSGLKEIERLDVSIRQYMFKVYPKAEELAQRFNKNHEKGLDTEGIIKLKKYIDDAAHQVNKDSSAIGNMESVPFQMSNDFEQAHRTIVERVDLIKETMTEKNQKIQDQFEMRLTNSKNRLKFYENERKYKFQAEIKSFLNTKSKQIHKESLLRFCKAMKETVKMTIYSTLTMSGFKRCSIMNPEIIKRSKEMILDIHELVKNHFPICCTKNLTDSIISQKIGAFLNMWKFRSINPWQIQLQRYFGIHRTHSMFDYASHYNGGRVIDEARISDDPNNTGDADEDSEKMLSDSLVHNIVASDMTFGNCWRISKLNSYATIKLHNPVKITHIGIEHIPRSISLDGKNGDAPKHFEIFVYLNKDQTRPILMGGYIYDNTDDELQIFKLKKSIKSDQIRILIKSNYGANQTCLYRFRVFSGPQ